LAARVYKRAGAHYVYLLLSVGAASILGLTVAATALLAFPYLGGSPQAFGRALRFALPWMAFVALCAELVNLRLARPLIRWLQGSRCSRGAVAAWEAAVIGMPRAVVIGTAVVVIGAVPAEIYGLHQLHAGSVGTGIAAATAVTLFIIAGGSLHYLLWERWLTPVVADVADHLPEDFQAPASRHTLSRKLLALVVTVNAVSCFVAAGLSTDSLGPGGKVAVGIATAMVVGGTLALGMTLLLRRSLITPLSELVHAMDRLGEGDLDLQLPPMSADELGAARRHFNSMVAGLRERATLRERNLELVDELRASRARVVAASDNARRRVERDLHDGAQQQLVLINLKLSMLSRQLPEGTPARAMADELRGNIEDALAELRDLAHGIYPQVLTSDGLRGALAEAAENAPIPVTCSLNGCGRFGPDVEAAVYFCCMEALQNAAKHGGDGTSATIRLNQSEGQLRFSVSDDGRGFDAGQTAGSGLHSMTDRIGALGGAVSVESVPGAGTTITGTIPVDR
jgi:signal transduction histidine kinase